MRTRLLGFVLVTALAALAQERGQQSRPRIDVQTVAIDAQINPQTQSINATAQVTFVPLDNTSSVVFELNNALDLQRVTDKDGHQISASRYQEDQSVRLNLPQPLTRGAATTLTFVYAGKLTGQIGRAHV